MQILVSALLAAVSLGGRTHAEHGRRGFGSWPLIGCDGMGWVLLQAVLLRGRGESSLLSFTPFTKSHPMGLAPGQLELPGERGLVSAIPLAGYPGEGWPVDTKNPGSTRRVFLENVTQAVWGSVATNERRRMLQMLPALDKKAQPPPLFWAEGQVWRGSQDLGPLLSLPWVSVFLCLPEASHCLQP